jgi:hypothetical protein
MKRVWKKLVIYIFYKNIYITKCKIHVEQLIWILQNCKVQWKVIAKESKNKRASSLCCFEFKSIGELAPKLLEYKSIGWKGREGKAFLHVLNIPCLDIF